MEVHHPSLIFHAVKLMVGRIEKMREWHLEGLGDFERIQRELERRSDNAHQRRDAKTRTRQIVRQSTEKLDMSAIKADLFLGFAQRSVDRRAIHLFQSASGKADLSGVMAQVIGAPGKQNGLRGAVIDQRHQHRRRHV